MCEDTGISYEEPSPNSFSFNSPYGYCPVCKGLGTVYQVSMDLIIPDWELSINDRFGKEMRMKGDAALIR